ncbi:MAG: TraM recognition domain-containing protein [Nitrososphaerota archaeon]|nr:TraM recognition domain-containing protein [Nitrososphaerota archaeon]
MRDIVFSDYLLHTYIIGRTGRGKSSFIANTVLNFLKPLVQKESPCSVIVIDQHGDLAFDTARGMKDWSKLIMIDPTYTRVGFNPLQPFSEPEDDAERASMLQNQVSQLTMMLSDVMKTSVEFAPRLTWIFKMSLYYLYHFPQHPSFLDLYYLMSDLASKKKGERLTKDEFVAMLKDLRAPDEMVIKTMEAISSLESAAFTPVMNRIADYVMPEHSYSARTFCSRNGRLPFFEMLAPGNCTIFRLGEHALPQDFRKLFAATLVLKIYFLVMERATRLEAEGKGIEARTPVFLVIDEFEMIENLEILRTIISEARKYGLFLILSHQTTSQINRELLESIFGNVGMILAFGLGKDDAVRLSKVFGKEHEKDLRDAGTGEVWVWRSPPRAGGGSASIEKQYTFPLPKRVHEQKELMDFMTGPMERLYGGAVEDRKPIYSTDVERFRTERGLPGCDPVDWNVLAFLHQKELGGGGQVLHRYVQQRLEGLWGWSRSVIEDSLLRLEKAGLLISRSTRAETVYKGKDEEGLSMYSEPTTEDEKERAITVSYELTPKAREKHFETRVHSARAGGPLHLKMIETYRERFERRGLWAEVDYGQYRQQRPDMIVFEPVKTTREATVGDEKKAVIEWASDRWDYMNAVAYEFETSPRKHQGQLVENYTKNAVFHTRSSEEPRLVFVVPRAAMAEEVERYIEPVLDRDKPNYSVQKAEIGLPEDEIERQLAGEGAAPTGAEAEAQSQAPPAKHPADGGQEREEGPRAGSGANNPAPPSQNPAASGEPSPLGSREHNGEQGGGEDEKTPREPAHSGVGSPPSIASHEETSDGKGAAPSQSGPKDEAPALLTGAPAPSPPEGLQEAAGPEAPPEPTMGRDAESRPRGRHPGGLSADFKRKMARVLVAIGQERRSSTDIAAAVGMSQRQALRYIDELVKFGLVSEEKKRYSVTQEGKKALPSR